jgi:hypothetical protein
VDLPGDGTPKLPGRLRGWRRRLVRGAIVAGSAVLAGAVIGILLVGGTPGSSRSVALAKLEPLDPGALVAVPRATPKRLDRPTGIGSAHAGLALLAREDVDEVVTADGRRRAPEGSRLIAFRVGDWTCEVQPCGSWRSLAPRVVVDGSSMDLPAEGDTFVAVVPPGAGAVDLVVAADGYTQSVSLVDEDADPDNIALLAERDGEKRVVLGRTFRLAEGTSVALDDGAGGRTNQFVRDVGVDYAQLRFFLHGQVPRSPRDAFLVVNTYYSYAGRPGRFVLGPAEVAFVDADGTRYEARDLDPSPDHGLVGFEVPASLRSGTLVIGGTTDKVSSTGVPYVSQLQEQSVAVDLR